MPPAQPTGQPPSLRIGFAGQPEKRGIPLEQLIQTGLDHAQVTVNGIGRVHKKRGRAG